MDQLSDYGWAEDFALGFERLALEGLVPARVVADFGTSLKIVTPALLTAELSGKLAHYASREDVPKVGDWVAVRLSDNNNAVVEAVMPRRSELARKAAGNRTVKQIIAANIDLAFVIVALDNDFSLERLKRYLYQLSASAIKPVIVLNKADKTDDLDSFTDQLQTLDLPIIITTATSGRGVDDIMGRIKPGQTAILLGSSGVGKSTLTNHLLGRQAQRTQEVRLADDTGKHTTVHRELFVLPNGGLLIDTPGIRELQLWGTEDELDEDFGDISAIANQCTYSNCRHGSEEGCAIRRALTDGSLDAAHYARYHKMKLELKNLKAKRDVRTQMANKRSHRNTKRQAEDRLHDMDD